MLHIELTKEEVSILENALDAYECEPRANAMVTAMLSTVMSPKETPEQAAKETSTIMEKGQVECESRRRVVLRLKLRLMEAQERPEEFSTEDKS